jgi:hypothetical protein
MEADDTSRGNNMSSSTVLVQYSIDTGDDLRLGSEGEGDR